MSDTLHSESHDSLYFKIFWWLLALTIVEVGLVYTPITRWIVIAALVILAFVKAGLVAANYMHLKFEKWTLAALALVPLVLIAILLLGILPDIGHVLPH